MPDHNAVHAAVRQHYGTRARAADPALSLTSASCCAPGSDCACGPTLYDAALLEGLPEGVTGLSLGCGDPVTIASLQPGETVLDLGSGGGIDCFLAARQVGPAGRVIGVDMTPEMLERATANQAALGVSNVEFRQGQIEALPVGDSEIDVVMSNCVINLAPDKEAVFAEVFRVLKPGGRLAISDIVTEGEFSPALRAELDRWAECVTGAIDIGAYTGLIQAAGFEAITIMDKASADDIVPVQDGMPRIYSARITAIKPA